MNKGLYIHYPFCSQKCYYCDFFSVPDTRQRESYEKALVDAIRHFKGYSVDTIYFGGGTPFLMTEDGGKRVFEAIYESFDVKNHAEITLEANPTTVAELPKRLEFFKRLGVNRLSLGVQSFSEKELEALGRGHSPQDAINTVKLARFMGFDNISLDLMLRIPHQTLDTFKESLAVAQSLSPEHLSLYTLSIEENTIFGHRAKKGDSLYLVGEESEEEMYFFASDELSSFGYEHYEVSNFAKDKRYSRHNLKYWNAEEYIGIGASAHAYLDGERFYYNRSINSFIEKPTKVSGREALTDKERALEKVMLSLRLKWGIDIEGIEKQFGLTHKAEFSNFVIKLVENGLAMFNEGVLSLTPQGFRLSNSIIESVLEYMNLI